MNPPIDFDCRFLVRFSIVLPLLGPVAHQIQSEGALSQVGLHDIYQVGQTDGMVYGPAVTQLTLDAVRRSQDPIAERRILAAMDSSRQDQYRFNRMEEFGALYMALDRPTAIAEVSNQFRTFWEESPEAALDIADYICVEATIDPDGKYFDLRNGVPAKYQDCLSPCRRIAYEQGQSLAAEKVAEGYHGIIYPSARIAAGVCFALFDLRKITLFRQGEGLTLRWNPSSGKSGDVEEV